MSLIRMVPVSILGKITLGKMLAPRPSTGATVSTPYLRAAHIQPPGILDMAVHSKTMFASPAEKEDLALSHGDVLIVEGGAAGRSAIVEDPPEGVIFQNSLLRFRADPKTCVPKYFYYAIRQAFESGRISTETSTVSIPHFTAEKLSRFRIPYYRLETQRAIANYLDRETAEIDSMLTELDELVAVLEERRLVVLERTTRALFTSWPSVKSELLVDIRTGGADTKDADPDGDFPFYVRSNQVERSSGWEFDCEAVLTAGDGAGVGKVFHRAGGKFMAHQRVYVINNFRRISRDYYFHVFKTLFPKVARDGSAKSTVDSVRRGMIADLKIPLPPEGVQQTFVREMSELDEQIRSMLSDTAELKSLLLERRSALITEVVTGRKQVV